LPSLGYSEEIVVDQLTKLKLAVAGSRYGHGEARLARRARELGPSAFSEVLDDLSHADLDRVSAEAEALFERGISATLLGSSEYPPSLSEIRNAPPTLFYMGSSELLNAPGIGMCGSRNATEEGLNAAAACGEVAARQGLAVVSGYARGVDMTTHVSALAAGGTTVIVLPEGIARFRVKRGAFADVWDPARALVVSQFAPSRPWSAGAAMTRNAVIIGLSLALVVIEASEKGGTLAAGTTALDLNRRVITLEFAQTPPGNSLLLRRGAVPVSNRSELSDRLEQLISNPGGNQLLII
jgi:DNA processing protein